jgi:hypothetical protein
LSATSTLESEGVRVVETVILPIERRGRAPVVYLVQPQLSLPSGSTTMLLRGADDDCARARRRCAARIGRLLRSNRERRDARASPSTRSSRTGISAGRRRAAIRC